jgi:acyl-lipid Delta6-acetylenase / acyl-lipid (9-3)-desaturase
MPPRSAKTDEVVSPALHGDKMEVVAATDSESDSVSDESSDVHDGVLVPALTMTREEVLRLADPDNLCLLIIGDGVYDCTEWQHRHPGGHLTVRALSGKDATDSFGSVHPEYVRKMLGRLFYARLDDSERVKRTRADPSAAKAELTRAAFADLTRRMEEAGMFKTDPTFYYRKAAVLSAMFLSAVAGVLLGGDRVWVHLLAGVMLGMFWQQSAFVAHDLGHNSVSQSLTTDSYLGCVLGNFMSGISLGWWKRSHNVHHIATNSADYDPDIQHLPVLAVDPIFTQGRLFSTYAMRYLPLDAAAHVLVRHQHYVYYPLMSLARFNLYAQSWCHSLSLSYYPRTELVWNRTLQVAALTGFWVWLIALTLSLPTWTSRVLFFLPAHMVAGVLHVQITLSHFSMPVYKGVTYDDALNGYLPTQLEGSLDIDCPPWMDWFHGGLQFQVEHHVWPRLPNHNLRTAKTMLVAFCAEHGLPHHQATFLDANRMMLAKLRMTGGTTKTFSELFGDSWNMQG